MLYMYNCPTYSRTLVLDQLDAIKGDPTLYKRVTSADKGDVTHRHIQAKYKDGQDQTGAMSYVYVQVVIDATPMDTHTRYWTLQVHGTICCQTCSCT